MKLVSAASAAIMAAMLISGCTANTAKEDEETISVYLWISTLYGSFATYIQSQLPEVNIEFVVGNNDLDFYKFMNENGKLPDIITSRRFPLHDAAGLKDQLKVQSVSRREKQFRKEYQGDIWIPLH